MLGDHFRPSSYELGFPEEPKKHGKGEECSYCALVERHRSHFVDFGTNKFAGNSFTLSTNSDLLCVVGIGPEEAHEDHLQPHEGNVHHYYHHWDVQHNPFGELCKKKGFDFTEPTVNGWEKVWSTIDTYQLQDCLGTSSRRSL